MKTDNHWQALVILLKDTAKEKGITQKVIAERTGITQQAISRMFKLRHPPTLKTFVAVARAIGVNLESF